MNWKYILIVVFILIFVVGGAFAWEEWFKIKIIFPKESEKLEAGKTYVISWRSPKYVKKVEILITDYSYSSEVSQIIAEDLVNTGSYSWTVPNLYDLSPDWKWGDNFRIGVLEKLERPKNGRIYGVQGESSNFVIVGLETVPPVTKNWPPFVGFYSEERIPAAGLDVSIENKWVLEIEDPDSTSFTYEIDWGDGTEVQKDKVSHSAKGEKSTTIFSHTYFQPGLYTVVVKVTDDKGAQSENRIEQLRVR